MRRSDTFWFSDTPAVVKSTSWGNRIERISTWAYFEDREGPAFYVFNVHLDHQSQPSRERSAALLLARIGALDPKAPVVVTGDFNAGENNPAARAMLAVFRDSFRVLHPDDSEVGTFNGFKPGQTGGDKNRLRLRRARHRGARRRHRSHLPRRALPVGPLPGDRAHPAAVR